MSEEVKDFEKVFDAYKRRDLFLMMDDPGWEVMKELQKEVAKDWVSKITSTDYRSVNDDKTIKDLIFRQGMIRGVEMFFNYVEQKKQKHKKETEDLLTSEK